MNVQPTRISCRIARRAGYQGARPSASDQAEVEKSATDLHSRENVDGNSNGSCSQQSPPAAVSSPICNQQTKGKRHKWVREEYKDVMLCYYKAQAEPLKDNITKETYRIWRQRNPNARPNMGANKKASQRRSNTHCDRSTWYHQNRNGQQHQKRLRKYKYSVSSKDMLIRDCKDPS